MKFAPVDTAERRLRRHLRRAMCSMPWVDAVLESLAASGKNDVFPPGPDTAMRSCSRCHRIGPLLDASKVCIDCESTLEERRFWRHLDDFTDIDLAQAVCRQWWGPFRRPKRKAVSYQEGVVPEEVDSLESTLLATLQDQTEGNDCSLRRTEHAIRRRQAWETLTRRMGWRGIGFRLYDPIAWDSLAPLPSATRWQVRQLVDVFAHRMVRRVGAVTRLLGSAFEDPELRFESKRRSIDLCWRNHRFRLLRWERDVGSGESPTRGGRAVGCDGAVLAEDEEQLLREIAFAQKTGKVMISTQRFTRSNPFSPAPEDHRTVADCFISRDLRLSDRPQKPR